MSDMRGQMDLLLERLNPSRVGGNIRQHLLDLAAIVSQLIDATEKDEEVGVIGEDDQPSTVRRRRRRKVVVEPEPAEVSVEE